MKNSYTLLILSILLLSPFLGGQTVLAQNEADPCPVWDQNDNLPPTLFLFDGSIDRNIDPNVNGGEYWRSVTRSGGPVEEWLAANNLPPKAPVLRFGLEERPQDPQKWEDFTTLLSSTPVAPQDMVPKTTPPVSFRRAYGIVSIAPYTAIQWLGRCRGRAPINGALYLVVFSDGKLNKAPESIVSEAVGVENVMLASGALLKGEKGRIKNWVAAINEYYSVEIYSLTETDTFPRTDNITDTLETSVYKVVPKNLPELSAYFRTDKEKIGLEMIAAGYESAIAIQGLENGLESNWSYIPGSFQVELIRAGRPFSGGPVATSSGSGQSDFNQSYNLKITAQMAESPPDKLRLIGNFYYHPKDKDTAFDLGFIHRAILDVPMEITKPETLPDSHIFASDSVLLTHEIMARHPGKSQVEIVEIYETKALRNNCMILGIACIFVAILAWLIYRNYHKKQDAFPPPNISVSLKDFLEEQISYDLQTIDNSHPLTLTTLVIENTAAPNKKNIHETLHVTVKISCQAVEHEDIGTDAVMTINNSQECDLEFTKQGDFPIILDLKKLGNMENALFPNNLLSLVGKAEIYFSNKEPRTVAIPVEINVKPMPPAFSVEIKLYQQEKVIEDALF